MLKSPLFEVKPPARPLPAGWGTLPVSEPYKPEWHLSIEKKRAFGARLGKGDRPLDAALLVFDNNQSDASWAVHNWLRDIIVVEEKERVENEVNLLDKDAFCRKLLKFADERTNQGFPAHDAKDRLKAWELYAEVQRFIGKVDVDLSNKTFVDNSMQIVLVEPEKTTEKEIVIEQEKVISIDRDLGIELKLVS